MRVREGEEVVTCHCCCCWMIKVNHTHPAQLTISGNHLDWCECGPVVVALAKSVNIRENISQICDPYLSCLPAIILDGFIWS